MAYSIVPSVSTNDTWSAAQNNTNIKDNFAALWPYTAAGDIPYATGASTLSKLAKPASLLVLTMDSTGVPVWQSCGNISGGLHTKGTVDFSPSQTITSTSLTDITGATLTLVTSVTCTIYVEANIVGYQATGGRTILLASVVGGVVDPNLIQSNGGDAAARNEALPYIYYATGVAAGNIIVKLQSKKDATANVYIHDGRLTAIAYAE
jgi:hypothetical protein